METHLFGISVPVLETQPGYVTIDPSDIHLTPEQWESLSRVFQQHQLQYTSVDAVKATEISGSEPVPTATFVQCVPPQSSTPSVSCTRAASLVELANSHIQRGDIFLPETCLLSPEQNPPSMCHFDEALNADALSDDVVTTSPAGHYCVDVTDAERMTLWNETTSPETFL